MAGQLAPGATSPHSLSAAAQPAIFLDRRRGSISLGQGQVAALRMRRRPQAPFCVQWAQMCANDSKLSQGARQTFTSLRFEISREGQRSWGGQ